MFGIRIEMDAVLVIKISITCCNLPVVRVMAIPKTRIVVLRVILQPRAEKVLKILYRLSFQLFRKKIAKRIGNFYICSKKEKLSKNTKMNASLP